MSKIKEVGMRLQRFRKDLGISQRTLAEKCGWGPSRIGNYESGTRGIDLNAAEVLAKALGIEPQQLFFDEDVLSTPKIPTNGDATVLGNMQIWDALPPYLMTKSLFPLSKASKSAPEANPFVELKMSRMYTSGSLVLR